MADQYTTGPTFTLAVADSSVGFTDATLKPVSGRLQGMKMEQAQIYIVGPLYVETDGPATTASQPKAAGDELNLAGHDNLKRLRFIRNTDTTSVVVIPIYR